MAGKIELDYNNYYDKVLAGWLGKSMGGVIGAPFENHKQFNQKTEDNIWPASLAINDDLDIQVVWLEAMQERGLFLSSHDLAECWQERCYHNYCEYGVFLNNIQRGIDPPLSGIWNNSYYFESEGCPIRSEIWGAVCPGNPQLAADYARLDARLDHGGVSVEIEQFLSAAAAQAFVTNDLNEALEAGLSVIPTDGRAALVVRDVRCISEKYPECYDSWRMIIRKYGDRDASKAITNHAIVMLALFLGELDFKKTMRICVNCGWDTDCTAATAGALLGILGGTKALPPDWKVKLGDKLICGIDVKHKRAPLVDFAAETCQIGIEMAAVRSKNIQISQAPPVAVRSLPQPEIFIDVQYPESPVLWDERSTTVNLIINNPTDKIFDGKLFVEVPEGIECENASFPLAIPPGKEKMIGLNIRRKMPGTWLADKNLFQAKLISRDGTQRAKLAFGLGGARQWMIYGPYWDMWDKTKNEICPYENEKTICPPGRLGYHDATNHYIRSDHFYLDESRIHEEDIPEELPVRLESGEDLITHEKLGGFKGQACYYMARTIKSVGFFGEVFLLLGRTGPCKIWMDGKLLKQWHDIRGWAPEATGIKCNLTGAPQRFVIKFIRLTDEMSFSLQFIHPVDIKSKRGVSYLTDCLEDFPGLTVSETHRR